LRFSYSQDSYEGTCGRFLQVQIEQIKHIGFKAKKESEIVDFEAF
jgi:hypothetical protein